jgi:hypothetical protein
MAQQGTDEGSRPSPSTRRELPRRGARNPNATAANHGQLEVLCCCTWEAAASVAYRDKVGGSIVDKKSSA